MDEHSSDLWDVQEGDTVSLTTTTGASLTGECYSRERQHPDPRTGEVRETHIWWFDYGTTSLIVSIMEGLKSSADDPEYPIHKDAWITGTETSAGYIDTLEIEETA